MCVYINVILTVICYVRVYFTGSQNKSFVLITSWYHDTYGVYESVINELFYWTMSEY